MVPSPAVPRELSTRGTVECDRQYLDCAYERPFVGNTQYIDAFHGADVLSQVKNTNYHLMLAPVNVAPIDIDVLFGGWEYGIGTCSYFGATDIEGWDAFIQTVLLPYVEQRRTCSRPSSRTTSRSCPAGYAACWVMTRQQSCRPRSRRVRRAKVAEWADDPFTANPTPLWGNTGQVVGCQGNLEVGDPLTPTAFPPVTMNGFTYHLQELAFMTWFYGGPWKSAGGAYSNNGTFTVPAMLCQ